MVSRRLMGVWAFLYFCLLAAGAITIALSMVFKEPNHLLNMVFSADDLTGVIHSLRPMPEPMRRLLEECEWMPVAVDEGLTNIADHLQDDLLLGTLFDSTNDEDCLAVYSPDRFEIETHHFGANHIRDGRSADRGGIFERIMPFLALVQAQITSISRHLNQRYLQVTPRFPRVRQASNRVKDAVLHRGVGMRSRKNEPTKVGDAKEQESSKVTE